MTFDDAKRLAKVDGAFVRIHTGVVYGAYQWLPGMLQVDARTMVTWCPPAAIGDPSHSPSVAAETISEEQVTELIALKVPDDRESDQSKQIVEMVAQWKKDHPGGIKDPADKQP